MASNGRAKGQISLGRPKVSFSQNKNSGTNRGGQRGTTRLARSTNNAVSGTVAARNSRSKTAYSAHAGQTVGLKGAKAGPGSRRAPIANSVPDRTTRNPSQYNTHVSSTIGLRGAGKPFSNQRRTTTQFDAVSDKISANSRKYNPHAAPTVGLRGAKLGNTLGTARRTNLGNSSGGDKNSSNPYSSPVHANETQGLTKAPRRSQPKGRTGTVKRPTGRGTAIPAIGKRRQVGSSLPPQRVYTGDIPAVVRAAARRAPTPTSSRPTFTSRVVKVTSK